MTTTTQQSTQPGLGTGIYTIGEAASLLHVPARTLRSWVDGYKRAGDEPARSYPPILARDGAQPGLLTFGDLIEMHLVREFRKAGVTLKEIRDAAKRLREAWGTPYPFAQRRIQTDGVQLLLESGEHYVRVANCQQVFAFVQAFFKDLDVDESGMVNMWHPMGHDRLIVLDPHRSYGAPIDIRSGIRSEVLYKVYLADRDIDAVADWYEVSPEAVGDAVEFEERWFGQHSPYELRSKFELGKYHLRPNRCTEART